MQALRSQVLLRYSQRWGTVTAQQERSSFTAPRNAENQNVHNSCVTETGFENVDGTDRQTITTVTLPTDHWKLMNS